MSLDNLKITSYKDSVSSLPNNPSDSGITAEQLKAVFDSRSDKEIKEKHNALVEELERHETATGEAIDAAKEDVLREISVIEGPPGSQGKKGEDGYSPTVAVVNIPGGHRVTITDVNGKHSFDVLDGEDGEGGAAGKDGGYYILSVAQVSDEVMQVFFTPSKTDMPIIEPMYIDLPRGADGSIGAPGENGYTPQRGFDYWTEADKAEIKSYVDEAILGGAW